MFKTNVTPDILVETPWQQCLQKICQKIGPASYETWFRTTDLFLENDIARIQVPNQFFADFIEEHFAALIIEVLTGTGIRFKKLAFVPTQKVWKIVEPISDSITETRVQSIPKVVADHQNFHPNYTFDRFIIGDSNRMAHAAAFAVAEAPGKTTSTPSFSMEAPGWEKPTSCRPSDISRRPKARRNVSPT